MIWSAEALRVVGERPDLAGDVAEAAAGLARARGFDRGVERKHVGLLGDVADRTDDLIDARRLLAELADHGGGRERFLAHGLHRRQHLGRGLDPVFGELLGVGALALGFGGVLGCVVDRALDVDHHVGDIDDQARLVRRAFADRADRDGDLADRAA